MPTRYCTKCQKLLDVKEFYSSNNKEKYPDGRLNQCKKCITMHVDNWDPETFKWILEEVDVPYIKEEWDSILTAWQHTGKPLTGLSILGRYLAKMKLRQWNIYHYADSEDIAEKLLITKVAQMKMQGMGEEEIEEQLAIDNTPTRPEPPPPPAETFDALDEETDAIVVRGIAEEDRLAGELTEEDKTYLRRKWGYGYKFSELVRMEQLYTDMINSYDIQGAGHKDTLVMICKASLKCNQCIDAGDRLYVPLKLFELLGTPQSFIAT